jgi:hypothetical protein
VTGGELLGAEARPDETVVLARTTLHGQVSVAQDGSFVYVPATGFVGTDSFWIAMARGSALSTSVEVVIRVVPSTASLSPPPVTPSTVSPSPSPALSEATARPTPAGDAFAIGGTSQGGPSGPRVSFGTLGPLEFAFEWLIPGFAVTLPGLLVVLAVLAQLAVGTGWLPLVRREIGDFGLRRRRRPGHPAG